MDNQHNQSSSKSNNKNNNSSNNSSNNSLYAVPPQGFEDVLTCPITLVPMTDPVVCPEGHSFQRAAIMEWLGISKTNPVTRKRLIESDLRPNRALKEACAIVARMTNITAPPDDCADSTQAQPAEQPAEQPAAQQESCQARIEACWMGCMSLGIWLLYLLFLGVMLFLLGRLMGCLIFMGVTSVIGM